MYILKAAFRDTVRILFFGSLKIALFAYTRFLPDSVVAAAASEGEGHAAKLLPAPWPELESLRRQPHDGHV